MMQVLRALNPFSIMLLMMLGLTGCYSGGLPQSMPDNFILEYERTGMLSPEVERIYLQKDSSYYEFTTQGLTNRISLNLGDAAWDSIYTALYRNKAASLKTYGEGAKDDKAGTVIRFRWDEEMHEIYNAGSWYLRDEDIPAYGEIQDHLLKYVNESLDPLRFDYSVLLMSGFIENEDSGSFHFLINNTRYEADSIPAGVQKPVSIGLLPGDYELRGELKTPQGVFKMRDTLSLRSGSPGYVFLLQSNSLTGYFEKPD